MAAGKSSRCFAPCELILGPLAATSHPEDNASGDQCCKHNAAHDPRPHHRCILSLDAFFVRTGRLAGCAVRFLSEERSPETKGAQGPPYGEPLGTQRQQRRKVGAGSGCLNAAFGGSIPPLERPGSKTDPSCRV
jgi:hypothetical protein